MPQDLTPEQIKAYVELNATKFTGVDQVQLRYLWLDADIAESLRRIAHQLENGQVSVLEAENIIDKLTIIGNRLPD